MQSKQAPSPQPPIYLDYSATTPVDPRVAEKMIPYLTQHFGNPASHSHPYGWTAEHAVDEARAQVAALVGADPKEIVWTSGATESNNLAIKGAARFHRAKGRHLVTLKTEHKSVLDTMRELERDGFEVTYLEPEADGLLDPEKFAAEIVSRPPVGGRAGSLDRVSPSARTDPACRPCSPSGFCL